MKRRFGSIGLDAAENQDEGSPSGEQEEQVAKRARIDAPQALAIQPTVTSAPRNEPEDEAMDIDGPVPVPAQAQAQVPPATPVQLFSQLKGITQALDEAIIRTGEQKDVDSLCALYTELAPPHVAETGASKEILDGTRKTFKSKVGDLLQTEFNNLVKSEDWNNPSFLKILDTLPRRERLGSFREALKNAFGSENWDNVRVLAPYFSKKEIVKMLKGYSAAYLVPVLEFIKENQETLPKSLQMTTAQKQEIFADRQYYFFRMAQSLEEITYIWNALNDKGKNEALEAKGYSYNYNCECIAFIYFALEGNFPLAEFVWEKLTPAQRQEQLGFSDWRVFRDSASRADLPVVEFLWEKMTPEQRNTAVKVDNYKVFTSAAEKGDLPVVQFFWDKMTPKQKGAAFVADNCKALVLAVKKGQVPVVEFFISKSPQYALESIIRLCKGTHANTQKLILSYAHKMDEHLVAQGKKPERSYVDRLVESFAISPDTVPALREEIEKSHNTHIKNARNRVKHNDVISITKGVNRELENIVRRENVSKLDATFSEKGKVENGNAFIALHAVTKFSEDGTTPADTTRPGLPKEIVGKIIKDILQAKTPVGDEPGWRNIFAKKDPANKPTEVAQRYNSR